MHNYSHVQQRNTMNPSVKILYVLLLATFCLSVKAIIFKDCGSLYGKIRTVAVAGCETTPICILRSGKNVSITVGFTTLEDTSVAKAVVHGIIAGVPVPFPTSQPNACENSGLSCPLATGQNYTYSAVIPVSSSYPKIKVVVRWELQEAKGKDLFCVEIPTAII